MKFLFFGFAFAGSVFLATMFYGPIIKNHQLEGMMIKMANERRLKDDFYLLRDLASYIEENKIPLKPEKIIFQRISPKEVIISARYKVHCKFYFLEKTYVFKPSTQNEVNHGMIPDFAAY